MNVSIKSFLNGFSIVVFYIDPCAIIHLRRSGFSDVGGSIIDPIAVPGQYEVTRV